MVAAPDEESKYSEMQVAGMGPFVKIPGTSNHDIVKMNMYNPYNVTELDGPNIVFRIDSDNS